MVPSVPGRHEQAITFKSTAPPVRINWRSRDVARAASMRFKSQCA
jgi:hypothetical protein